MRLAVLAAALVLSAASAVSAQVGEGPTRTFGARDLFGLQQAGDPQVRPDGGAIAYVRASNDIMTDRARRSIWLADPQTGAHELTQADVDAWLDGFMPYAIDSGDIAGAVVVVWRTVVAV